MFQSILAAALALLAGLLGFIWRGYSKATAKANALAEVIRQRAKAEQVHTTAMETIDATEQELESADSHSLAGDLDALFGGGGSVPQDDADGGGSDGPL